LDSAVFKWPGRDEVLAAARRRAAELQRRDPQVRSVYCVGSCARGDWGVGSDLDVIVIVEEADPSPVARRSGYEPTDVPVPAGVWVYTVDGWQELGERSPGLARRLRAGALDLLSGRS